MAVDWKRIYMNENLIKSDIVIEIYVRIRKYMALFN